MFVGDTGGMLRSYRSEDYSIQRILQRMLTLGQARGDRRQNVYAEPASFNI